jgi:hypothetical protein
VADRPPIEWDEDGFAAVRHVVAGAVVGVGFLVGAGALVLTWRSLRAGAYDRLVAIVLVLALLPLTGRALLGLHAVDTPAAGSLRRRPLLLAGGAWALVLAATVRWRPLAAVGLLAGAAVLWFVVTACRTSGRIDPATATLTYGARTASLAGLDGTRRVPFGPVTVYWLSFERGSVGSGVPRLLVVPRRVDADVRTVLDRAAATGDEDAGEVDTSGAAGNAERAVAATIGLGFLLAGPVAWLLLPASADATLVTGYLTLLGLPFALVLLRYALVA